MVIINMTSPLTLILVLITTVLLIFLGQEVKKSYIAVLPLIVHLGLIVIHVIQLLTLSAENMNLSSILAGCIAIDFGFILVSFFAYLWIDDIEAKATNKESVDSSLDWFWKKV